jgi:hypothetical protein
MPTSSFSIGLPLESVVINGAVSPYDQNLSIRGEVDVTGDIQLDYPSAVNVYIGNTSFLNITSIFSSEIADGYTISVYLATSSSSGSTTGDLVLYASGNYPVQGSWTYNSTTFTWVGSLNMIPSGSTIVITATVSGGVFSAINNISATATDNSPLTVQIMGFLNANYNDFVAGQVTWLIAYQKLTNSTALYGACPASSGVIPCSNLN